MVEVAFVNRRLREDRETYIQEIEKKYSDKIELIGREILKKDSSVVLLSGPSSSGKTTTALRLKDFLKENMIETEVISLDDFYLNREEVPLNNKGYSDLETVNSLDIKELHLCLNKLLTTGEAEFPIFNFSKERRKEKKRLVRHDKNHVLIIEGIHALNPIITDFNIGKNHDFVKIYISVNKGFIMPSGEILTNNEVRFIRRVIRDFHYRDASIKLTFAMWASVREGEKKYINPFIESADFIIDSFLDYAPGIFKEYLVYFIEQTDKKDKKYEKLLYYSDMYNLFETVTKADIPKNSLLQEFLWKI